MRTYRTTIEIPVAVEYDITPADTLDSGEPIPADVEITAIVPVEPWVKAGFRCIPRSVLEPIEDEIYEYLKEQKGNP